MAIIHNRIKCLKCGETIESLHRHDFRWCKCEGCAVDGGVSYLKRSFTEPEGIGWIEMSEFTKEEVHD